jgi:deoxyribodipyrimidine photolyase-like uncharacterized protein
MSDGRTLRLILGDQLNHFHPWYSDGSKSTYLLMEMRQETDYVRHHVQKVIAFFLAMREFAAHLQAQGHEVIYLRLDDADNEQELEKKEEEFKKACKKREEDLEIALVRVSAREEQISLRDLQVSITHTHTHTHKRPHTHTRPHPHPHPLHMT